jgi:hypothetical protein
MGTDCSTSARTAAVASAVSHLLARSGGGVLAGPTARIVSLPHSSQRSALRFIEDQEAPRVDRVEKPLSDSRRECGCSDRQVGGG